MKITPGIVICISKYSKSISLSSWSYNLPKTIYLLYLLTLCYQHISTSFLLFITSNNQWQHTSSIINYYCLKAQVQNIWIKNTTWYENTNIINKCSCFKYYKNNVTNVDGRKMYPFGTKKFRRLSLNIQPSTGKWTILKNIYSKFSINIFFKNKVDKLF